MNKGMQLWERAKRIIPGGTQLVSKRVEMFLPDQWAAYFKKAKGVEVWDLDGHLYIDMTIMGVGTCILGYADDDVNNAVKAVIDTGSMCTLNSPEEVELAELLIDLHPWAGGVRFGRSGGESTAIAVRIGRGYSGKDTSAFCGYHGWQDWYLAANLADDKNLDGHLLSGLQPLGVPRGLKGTALPFTYNCADELRKIVKENDVGVIIMEVVRHHEPENNFLQEVRNIATENGIVLIFDEITSGFRATIGGIHTLYDVYPDIVVYGKAMGNGFPITAIVGKRSIMEIAQESFISSTFWTERIGSAAAIATIRKMKEKKVPEHLCHIGNMVKHGWQEKATRHGLDISVMGIAPLPTFTFNYENALALQTLFTQEMLKRGYLASGQLYVSYCHTEDIVAKYLVDVDDVFEMLARAMRDGSVLEQIKGSVAHSGFKRLA